MSLLPKSVQLFIFIALFKGYICQETINRRSYQVVAEDITFLQRLVLEQQVQIVDIERKTTTQEMEIVRLEEAKQEMENQIAELRNTEMARLAEALQEMENQIAEQGAELDQLRNTVTEESIGFTAYATASRQYTYNDLVIFDGVVTNVGNHYNPDTSTFTCPRDGLYVFYITVASALRSNMYGAITKENQWYVTAKGDDDDYEPGTAMAVLSCASGERVWIECPFSGAVQMYGNSLPQYRQSMFSGFLLQGQ